MFEVDLLKSQEIDLDYILGLLWENNKNIKDKDTLIEEIKRIIKSSIENRAKESLIIDFIKDTDLDSMKDKADIIAAFYPYAKEKLNKEADTLISEENLNDEAAKRYIESSLKRKYATENGTDLNEALPRMSPLNPQYLTKKQSVFKKITKLIEKFKDISETL